MILGGAGLEHALPSAPSTAAPAAGDSSLTRPASGLTGRMDAVVPRDYRRVARGVGGGLLVRAGRAGAVASGPYADLSPGPASKACFSPTL